MKDKVIANAQFDGQTFQNTLQTDLVTDYWAMTKMYLFDKQQPASPNKPIEVQAISQQQLQQLQQRSGQCRGFDFFRLGHSTLLILLNGEYWLIDPVFSLRASPFSFVGPKRFHQPPITIEQLPFIKGVFISRHYDHLDKATIKKIKHKVEHFYTPLGVGEDLIAWGVAPSKVTQLDWWENVLCRCDHYRDASSPLFW